jgi:hypothetical protein
MYWCWGLQLASGRDQHVLETRGGNAARANEYPECSIQSRNVIEHTLPPLDSWRSGERKEGVAIDLTFERQEHYTWRTCL